ncbi:MAG TPA: tetratricopeptide repeat protein, partial [Stenomitos sp.]
NPSHQAAYYQRMYSLGVLKESAAHLQGLHQVFAAPPKTPPQEQNDPVAISAELIEPSSPSISAREAAPQTLKLEPEDLMGYFERATKRAMNGDLEGAIADYTQIITLDPHNTQAYFRRGQNLSALGQEDEALKDLNQALHWARVHSLGQLKDFSGAISETIQTLKTELQKPKPSKTTTISTQAVTIEDSIADYTRTIEQQPTANVYFKRAQSRALLGDLQGAIADYTETIRLDPEYSEAYYRRGLSRSALGDTAGATQDLNQAIRRKPAAGEDSIGAPSTSNPSAPLGNTQLANDVNLNPSNYCNHAGNRPGHRFCIHCGEMLLRPAVALPPTLGTTQPATLNNPRLPEPSEAEKLLQRGRTQCQSGKLKEGLTDLSNALKLFLEEQQMERYQETLQVLQEFSRRV